MYHFFDVKLVQLFKRLRTSEFEHLMPFRRYFTKSKGGSKSHHVHMVGYETEFWKKHLAFRDHLRTNERDKEDYYSLKLELAKKDWENGSEYANAKSEFILNIQQKIKLTNK